MKRMSVEVLNQTEENRGMAGVRPLAFRGQVRCGKCGHAWWSRVKVPKACPRCKRYDWSKG